MDVLVVRVGCFLVWVRSMDVGSRGREMLDGVFAVFAYRALSGGLNGYLDIEVLDARAERRRGPSVA